MARLQAARRVRPLEESKQTTNNKQQTIIARASRSAHGVHMSLNDHRNKIRCVDNNQIALFMGMNSSGNICASPRAATLPWGDEGRPLAVARERHPRQPKFPRAMVVALVYNLWLNHFRS
jgi:hypothetical protein